tara:strand:- start:38609 stop:38809 length:201 start_codon:yes stop_codon:yes gene_type:complete
MSNPSDWYDDTKPYVSCTFRPCCGRLWEEDHQPTCPQLAEEKIEADHEEWGRVMVFMGAAHIDPQC